jgi:hypothetical protein
VGLLFASAILFLILWIRRVTTTAGHLFEDSLILLVPAAATALLAVFVAKGSRAARILALVFGVLSLISGLALIGFLDLPRLARTNPLAVAIVLLLLFLVLPASLLLYPKARLFYRSKGETPQPLPTPGKPTMAPMSGALKLLIGLGAVVVLVVVVGVAANLRAHSGSSGPAGAVQPDWTPTTPEQVACAAVRDELTAGTLFDRSSQHARDIHARVISPLTASAGTNRNFGRQQLIFALADWQAYVGNDSNRLTPAQILAELDSQCRSYGAPIGN